MVKAIRVHAPGGPDVLRLEDVELPPPAAGEVQIRQEAIGVNYIDVYRRTGFYPAPLPFVPGHEGAGEVVAVGPKVTGFGPGDRVAYVSAGLGGYSAARNIEAAALVHLPASISYALGAAMMLKGLTAQYLVRRTFRVEPGHRVLVHAGAGGVGQLLCRWAKGLGAEVIATVGGPEKAEIAKAAGAKHVILYREEDFAARVREITGRELCHVVYDGVGAATFPASLDCLRPFGMFVSFGSASGPIAAFDLGLLGQKGSLYATRPTLFAHIAKRADYEAMTADVVDAIARGHLVFDPVVRRPLAEAQAVHVALESRQTTGSVVLEP
jgi:NADPH2:quinone reductase